MKQILLNYLFVLVLPAVAGATLRFLLRRKKWGGALTAIALGAASVAAWVIAVHPPVLGSELYGLRAVQFTAAFFAAVVTSGILRLKRITKNK
jgi:uncharacterized membrane protein YeaQ/YmgE (transglycosylase-associated protein family)